MPPKLALLIGFIFVLFAFLKERKRDFGKTTGLFWPTLWYVVVATRPIGVWLITWGVPLPGVGDDPVDGSLIDRLFFAILTVIGLRILSRRGFQWGALIRKNKWLTFFIIYLGLSILWSSFPYVSFKRFIKLFGSVVMALVVLTNDRPFESILTVLRRCLYIHLPMSLICTRYFREIGVSFEWDGHVEFWKGISTSKNTLGQICMLGVLYFTWDILHNWRQLGIRNIHILYLLIALFLLKGSDQALSLTSLVVCVYALFIFFGIQAMRKRQGLIPPFVTLMFIGTMGLVSLVMVHSVVMFPETSFFGRVITTFGRDITLTDRTLIWSDVYKAASGNPLFGVGFGGFWIGREANIPWNETMTWILGQAHSGYVDTYLQTGIIGEFLLAGVLVFSLPKMLASLKEDFDYGCLRLTLLLTIAFINITESIYLRGDHDLWLIFMFVLWSLPTVHPPEIEYETEEALPEDAAV